MKIVLFGASGMLGSDITNVLSVVPDFEVRGFDSHEVDITNTSQVLEALHIEKPNYVVNCAAYTNVDGAEEEEEMAMKVNGYSLHNISEACNEVDAHLIHFSTDYVFNGRNSEGYKEDDQTDPINTYGRSKLQGEEEITRYCKNYSIIRTSWLFGKNGKNFVETMRNLLLEKDEIKVVGDQVGSPTNTHDLAESILDMIQNGFAQGKNIYHRTNAGTCSWYEFAGEIKKIIGAECAILPCSSDEFPRPAKRPSCSILLNTKLPHLRDWKISLVDYFSK